MAIAGKVAITLSTENGGAWSADITYDRLVAVKHNNNLYISRKTVANVEPPNDEFWFLALEGFGGEDVEALIDRMNELSDLIQAIINGTTQVGNAKTLDGHEAEYFAKGTDLANYLPLNNTTFPTVKNPQDTVMALESTAGTNSQKAMLRFIRNGTKVGDLGFNGENKPVFTDTSNTDYSLLHTGNKPTGTYTGNGSTTSRTIAINGKGGIVKIKNDLNSWVVFVTDSLSFAYNASGEFKVYNGSVCYYKDAALTIAANGEGLNASGRTYTYEVL